MLKEIKEELIASDINPKDFRTIMDIINQYEKNKTIEKLETEKHE